MSVNDPFSLAGRIALITGGSRGIGRAIAIAMAERGADVAIVYRQTADRAAELQGHIEGLGRRVWLFQHDLADTATLQGLVDRIWSETGRIDVLVNNAAQNVQRMFNEYGYAEWCRIFAVNLDAPFFLAKRVAEYMIADGIKGRIINISSKNGIVASSHVAAYNATKGGLEMVTRSLAIELGCHGITTNSLCPGETRPDDDDGEEIDETRKFIYEHIPLEYRPARLQEVAHAAVFMASDAASYMNGQQLVLDGGMIIQQVPRLPFMPPYEDKLNADAGGKS